jgi:hypothetical protein
MSRSDCSVILARLLGVSTAVTVRGVHGIVDDQILTLVAAANALQVS